MLSKVTRLVLVFVVLLAVMAGQAVGAAVPSQDAAKASTPLWKLEKGGKALYLLGAFHLLDNVDYRENPAFQRAFRKADVVVFETDFADLESPKTQRIIRSQGGYGAGKSLRSEISPSTYRLLAQAAAELGLPMAALDALRPWLCAVTVTARKYRQLGFRSEYGVDNYFYRRARQAGKRVVALETPEYQVSLFAGLPPELQEQMLARTLEDLDLFEEQLGPLVAAWRNGAAEELDRLLLQNFRDYPLVYERLVTERNRRWLQQLEPLMRTNQTVLVVVGAAHLVGSEGLLRLLQERGYRVEQQSRYRR